MLLGWMMICGIDFVDWVVKLRKGVNESSTVTGDGSYGGEPQVQLDWHMFFRIQRSCDLCLPHHYLIDLTLKSEMKFEGENSG